MTNGSPVNNAPDDASYSRMRAATALARSTGLRLKLALQAAAASVLFPVPPLQHFCIRCHHRWTGDGLAEYCGDCHRLFLATLKERAGFEPKQFAVFLRKLAGKLDDGLSELVAEQLHETAHRLETEARCEIIERELESGQHAEDDAPPMETIYRWLEDVLIPMWKGDPITEKHRRLARTVWERIVDERAEQPQYTKPPNIDHYDGLQLLGERTQVKAAAAHAFDTRKMRRAALLRRVLDGLIRTVQLEGMIPDRPLGADDVRAYFTNESAIYITPLVEAVDILEEIIFASDGCMGHRHCAHSMEPWQRARDLLKGKWAYESGSPRTWPPMPRDGQS